MSVFVDTSALLAVLLEQDVKHVPAEATWESLIGADEHLVTTNYVVVEFYAILQRRCGTAAVQIAATTLVPALAVHWVDPPTHDLGVAALLAANRRGLGLVDCVSFLVMRGLGITEAFAFDAHFAEQGFRVLPAGGTE